jgi:microcystin-dependent protein
MSNFKIMDGLEIESALNPFYSPGDIAIYTSISVPSGWLPCNGQTYSETQYPELASAIGKYYGNNSEFRIPNMNADGLVYANYVAGTIGNDISQTFTTLNTHSHNLSAGTRFMSTYALGHTHNYSYNGNNETDDHRHEWVHQNAGGTAWSISGDVANYSTAGSSGGTAFRNHAHNHNGSNLNSSNVATTHSHAHSGSTLANIVQYQNHSHSYAIAYSSNSQIFNYPESISVKFMIKV